MVFGELLGGLQPFGGFLPAHQLGEGRQNLSWRGDVRMFQRVTSFQGQIVVREQKRRSRLRERLFLFDHDSIITQVCGKCK